MNSCILIASFLLLVCPIVVGDGARGVDWRRAILAALRLACVFVGPGNDTRSDAVTVAAAGGLQAIPWRTILSLVREICGLLRSTGSIRTAAELPTMVNDTWTGTGPTPPNTDILLALILQNMEATSTAVGCFDPGSTIPGGSHLYKTGWMHCDSNWPVEKRLPGSPLIARVCMPNGEWTIVNMGCDAGYQCQDTVPGQAVACGSNYKPIYVASGDQGLLISRDGGNTWIVKTATDGLPSTSFLSVFAAGRKIYVATWNRGLYLSDDSGKTWTVANGVPNETRTVLRANDKIYVATDGSGLYISGDEGRTWTRRSWTSTNGYIRSLFVDGNTIYAGTINVGLAISKDEGVTWTMKDAAHGLVSGVIGTVFADRKSVV